MRQVERDSDPSVRWEGMGHECTSKEGVPEQGPKRGEDCVDGGVSTVTLGRTGRTFWVTHCGGGPSGERVRTGESSQS